MAKAAANILIENQEKLHIFVHANKKNKEKNYIFTYIFNCSKIFLHSKQTLFCGKFNHLCGN